MTDLTIGPTTIPDEPYGAGEPLCDVCGGEAFIAVGDGWTCANCETRYRRDGTRLNLIGETEEP